MKKCVKQQKKINRKLQQKDLYENSIYIRNLCTDKNNYKNKTNLCLSPFTPVTVFLIAY